MSQVSREISAEFMTQVLTSVEQYKELINISNYGTGGLFGALTGQKKKIEKMLDTASYSMRISCSYSLYALIDDNYEELRKTKASKLETMKKIYSESINSFKDTLLTNDNFSRDKTLPNMLDEINKYVTSDELDNVAEKYMKERCLI
ncbi:MAG: hypothetical protein GXZ00_04700 [Synergistaceae bacterium]|nr:hypothetical protein [Synergistaceae bacterium]